MLNFYGSFFTLITIRAILKTSGKKFVKKKVSVGTPSAEGARIEAPQAPRGIGCGEGVSPFPPGEEIFIPKWWVLVQYEALFATFHSLLLHSN